MNKKVIILSIFFSFLFTPAFAEDLEEVVFDKSEMDEVKEEVQLINTELPPLVPPKWEEFCESGYENAKVVDERNVLNIINVVNVERTKSNYWAERKANFQKSIDHCNTLEEEQKAFCYEGVRKVETERNEMYEQQRKQINYKNRGIIIDKPNY